MLPACLSYYGEVRQEVRLALGHREVLPACLSYYGEVGQEVRLALGHRTCCLLVSHTMGRSGRRCA